MENKKTFFKSASLGYINIILISLTQIISQPLLLNYLDVYLFGVWTVTLSLLIYLGNSSVGIPTAAIVLISGAKNEITKKKVVIRSIILLIVSSVLMFILCFLIDNVFSDWIKIIGKVPNSVTNIAKQTVIISVIFLLIRTPMQIAQAVFLGYQDIHIGKIYDILNTLAPFVVLLITIKLDLGLVNMATLLGIVLTIISAISLVHLSLKHKVFNINKGDNEISEEVGYKRIFNNGLGFFVIGISTAIIYNTDSLVISNVIGADQIAPYALTNKLYNMPLQIFNVLIGVIFPMYGVYYANRNFKWIQNTYSIMASIFPLIGGAIWIGGLLIARDILNIWVGSETAFGGYMLLFAMGGVVYSLSSVHVHSTLLAGIDKKKELVRLVWIEGIANLVLSIILGKFFGIIGVGLGTMFASFLIPYILLPKYVYRNTDGKVKNNILFTLKHLFMIVLPTLLISFIIIKNVYDVYHFAFIYKLLICLIIVVIYLLISYSILPKASKMFLSTNINNILIKAKIKRVNGKLSN